MCQIWGKKGGKIKSDTYISLPLQNEIEKTHTKKNEIGYLQGMKGKQWKGEGRAWKTFF